MPINDFCGRVKFPVSGKCIWSNDLSNSVRFAPFHLGNAASLGGKRPQTLCKDQNRTCNPCLTSEITDTYAYRGIRLASCLEDALPPDPDLLLLENPFL